MHACTQHSTGTQRRDRQGWWCLPWSLVAVVTLRLALVTPPPAHAETFACDAGDVACLIDAITTANANGQTNTIHLAAGTYTLTAVHNDTDGPNGLPSLTSPLRMTIQGAGAASTIIARDPSAPRFRLFHVAATGALTLHGLTVRGGEVRGVDSPSGDAFGGGIWNRGTLLLQHTLLASNVARGCGGCPSPAGGGLYNGDGRVTLIDSTVAGNLATSDFGADGGGLWNGGTMSLTRSTLRDNGAQGDLGSDGGGLWNGGTVTLTDCVLTGNAAAGRFARGGGISNEATLFVTNTILTHNTVSISSDGGGGGIWSTGMLDITQSTFTSNQVSNGPGGGLYSRGTVRITTSTFTDNTVTGGGSGSPSVGGGLSVSGTGSLTNTTVVHNFARDFAGATARGGGLEVNGGVTLTNCTIAENVADAFAEPGDGRAQGGGISGSTVSLQNTILARNRSQIRAPDEPDAVSPSECDGPLTSLGTNLIGDPTGCPIPLQASDLTGAPGFGAFTDNGTPGNGHFPLLPTSQAINAGNNVACPPTDQLGQPRVAQCDIGAIEFHPHDTTPPAITVAATPETLWPPNGKLVPVTITGRVTDAGSGVDLDTAIYIVTDEYGSVHPSGSVTIEADGSYAVTIKLQASRHGNDKNGRQYTITVSALDNEGNEGSAATSVIVPHDQGH
jgi:hypothetical protein